MDTAAEVVAAVPSSDDAGARTADLYDWQAAMAAADGLRMYVDALDHEGRLPPSATGQVICEHHEDWTLVQDPDAELVSCKHRELSSGAWTTIRVLVDKGGLAHLFSRWLALEGKPSVRLVTCAGLAAGLPCKLATTTRLLRDEKAGQQLDEAELALTEEITRLFARELNFHRDGLPEEWQAPADAARTYVVLDEHVIKVRLFLAQLVIEESRPNRDIIAHAAPTMYAGPVVQKLGVPDAASLPVWEAVLQLFRARMRARGPREHGDLPVVFAAASISRGATTSSMTEASLEGRIVDLNDIDIAVRVALRNPQGYMPLASPAQLTRLSIKMARGGCSDTSIARAERLRTDFKRYRRERDTTVPGAIAEQRNLERHLMRIADDATHAERTPAGTWGALLWHRLSQQLNDATGSEWLAGLDTDLALGAICDLAAKCHIWFSPHFDVRSAMRRLRDDREANRDIV